MSFVFAQEVTVNMPLDWLGLSVSALAVVVAGWAASTTYRQGRALQKIETQQHEWEKIDRISAAIEVTGHQGSIKAKTIRGQTYIENRSEYLRLTNTGRAAAENVVWSDDADAIAASRDSIEILHPGEHYDLVVALNQSVAPGWKFTVKWTDDRGQQSTERRISL